MLKCGISCKISLAGNKIFTFCSLTCHGHSDYKLCTVRRPTDYKPESDSRACENPFPKLNGGSLDYLFGDERRRLLAKDLGGKI